MKNQTNNTAPAVDHQPIVLPLRVIDLDSPFFFGVGRDMTFDERMLAEKHGRYDNPPMSVLGVTSEGLAAVEGEHLAQMFAAAPDLVGALKTLLAVSECADETGYVEDCGFVDIETVQQRARDALAKALGPDWQNSVLSNPSATGHSDGSET